jgi:hypothetical protein
LVTGPGAELAWSGREARRLRYAILWGVYENNAFDTVHKWSEAFVDSLDLYEGVRSIYSPARRIGEFYAEHVYPGQVDPEAGDGSGRPSGAPIVGASDPVREALAAVIRDSRIGDVLDVLVRHGAVCGDAFLRVWDAPKRMKVGIEVIPPWEVADLDLDAAGNCRGYTIERLIPDPRAEPDDALAPPVLYKETCRRDGRAAVFETYLEGEPADLSGAGWRWSEPYGFVPLVHIRHRHICFMWGASELHGEVGRLAELDALVSRIVDHVHIAAEAPLYLEGGKATNVKAVEPDDDGGRGRRRGRLMLSGEGKPHNLVAPLNVEHVAALARELLRAIEAAHPELVAGEIGPAASGESRREARRQAEARVVRRRAAYDDGLARALKMALTIGGMGGYPGFDGIDRFAYERGDLDFAIGPRPVFATDQMARLEEEERRGRALKAQTDAGLPLAIAMRRCGFPDDDVRRAAELAAQDADAALARAVRLGFSDGGGLPDDVIDLVALPAPGR